MKKYCVLFFSIYLLFFSLSLFAQQQQPAVRFANGNFVTGSNIKKQQFKKENIRTALFSETYFVLLQFDQLPDKQARLKLENAGINLHEYLPGNAYYAAVKSDFDFATAARWNIASVNAIPAAYKINPGLKNYKPSYNKSDNTLIAISYSPSLEKEQVEAELAKAGAVVMNTKFKATNVIFIQPDIRVINQIAALPFVNTIGLQNISDKLLNYNSRAIHGVETLNAANGRNLNGKGVTIGIGDNADISTHIDFAGRSIARLPYIPSNHGIHVTGTAAGAGIINPKYQGMAPRASIINQFFSDVITSVPTYVKDNNLMVTNNSYFSAENECLGEGEYDVLSNYIDQQTARYPQLTHVFAAGNDGELSCSPLPPFFGTVKSGWQSAKNVLTVGAMNARDNSIASFSSRGPLKDGRIKPDITANGWAVASTIVNNNYAADYGTSMSAPAVTGAMALLIERYRQLHGGSNPTAALMKTLLCNTAEDLGNAGPDYTFGFGMLEAARAVDALEQNRYSVNAINNGSNATQNITVPANTRRIKIMLYWADTAAASNAATSLVNDLDLTVKTPGATIHYPLVLNPSPATVNNLATEGVDHINNMEQVVIDNPVAGNYTVSVAGFSVPFGPQEYVVSYEIIQDAVTLQYPAGGEKLVPGEIENIRWIAYGSESNTFTIEYSADNGASWTTINNNVPATARLYSWTVPAGITTNGLIRVSRNGTLLAGQSSFNFTILGQPVVTAANACEGAVQLNWSGVTGVTSYDILQLNGDTMKVIGNTTATTFLVKGLDKKITAWLGVAARNGLVAGRRSLSVQSLTNGGDCTLATFNNDLKVDSILSPATARQHFLAEADATAPVKISIKNLGSVAATGPFAVAYTYGGATVTEVLNTVIPAGGSYTYTFSGAYPVIAAGFRYDFKAWITAPADVNHLNDTAYKTVKSINNDAITAMPFVEGFEGMPNADFTKAEMAIGENKYLDFAASSIRGRARTFVNTGESRTGNRSITLDQWPTGNTVDSLTINYNLVNYAADQLRFDFYYLNHGQTSGAGNKIWIRGSESDPWLLAYDLLANQAAVGKWKHGIININEVLNAAVPVQSITETFQIKMGEDGRYAANAVFDPPNNIAPPTNRDDGYTFDDLKLNQVFNDVELKSINSPEKTDCQFSANHAINVTVKNFTNKNLDNISVSYQVNGGSIVTENIATITANQSLDYTFSKTADLSAFIDYDVHAWVHYAGDSYPDNDSILSYAFHASPLISTFPYLQSFEDNDGNFYAKGINSSWKWGEPVKTIINKAPNGTKAWVTSLTGNYNNDETSYLYSPCFDLATLKHPVLSFSHIFQVEKDYDYSWVEYSTDGLVWTKLGDTTTGNNWYDNALNNWNVTNDKWHVASMDLPYTGKNIRFRFVLNSDGGLSMEGIGIDDIRVHEKSIIEPAKTVKTVSMSSVKGDNWLPFVSIDSVTGQTSIIAEINPNGQDLGKMEITVYPNTTGSVRYANNQYYLDRNYVVHPSNPPTGAVGVRLYFTDAEADSLINAKVCTSCVQPADAYELGITKYSGLLSEENGTLADDNNGFVQYVTPENTLIVPHGNGYYAAFTVSSFSEMWFNNGGADNTQPLPVDLVSFSASKQSGMALLTWKTVQEINVAKYELERRAGSGGFTSITTLNPNGSGTSGNYNYVDSTPLPGINYYRVKIITRDGQVIYSATRKIDFGNKGDDVLIYPNPVTGNRIFISASANCSSAVLYDAAGKLVKSYPLQGTSNVIDVHGIEKGVYLLKVISANDSSTQKILIQ